MTSETSKHNIKHDVDGLHIVELTELALYHEQVFHAIEKMLDADVPNHKVLRIMRKILNRDTKQVNIK